MYVYDTILYKKYGRERNNLATLEKLIQSIMSGVQDKNIKFADLQKILDIIGFQCRVKATLSIGKRESMKLLTYNQMGIKQNHIK